MIALAACTLVAIPVARSHLEGTTITFSVSVTPVEKPALEELLRRFEHRTRARVNFERLPRFRGAVGPRVNLSTGVGANDLAGRLREQLKSHTPSIDLFAQDNVALRPLVDQGLVQELPDIAVEHEAVPAMVLPGLRRWFLPFRPNVRLTYARKADLGRTGLQLPTTEEELTNVARALKGTGDAKVTMSLATGDATAVTVSELIVSHGGKPSALNDAGSIEAFTFLQQLWQEGLISRSSLFAKYDTEVANLRNGVSSLAQNWSFTSAELADAGQIQDFAVYSGWSGPGRAAHVIGGDVLGIPKGVDGKRREAAVALAQFLMSRQSQQFLAQRNIWPSYRNDVDETGIPNAQRETFAAMRDALKDGWLRPSDKWEEVTELMNRAVQLIVVQGMPVRPILDEIHGQMP